jgi:ureidoacrylate peracid hydrolase
MTIASEATGLLVIDPYNDFISEGGKVWDRLKAVAEANGCIPHMKQVLDEARAANIQVFYALHRRYRPGDYETWKNIAPIQKAAWDRKTFEFGTWGGELRQEFQPINSSSSGSSRTRASRRPCASAPSSAIRSPSFGMRRAPTPTTTFTRRWT